MPNEPGLEDKVAAAEIKYTQRPYFKTDTIAREAGFTNATGLDEACQKVRGMTFIALREELKKQDEKTAPKSGSNNPNPEGHRFITIKMALALSEYANASLLKIATMAGYTSPHAFQQAFKAATKDIESGGLTPGGYRKQALQYMIALELLGQIPPPPEPGGDMG